MEFKNSKYLLLLVLHLFIGGVLYVAPFLAKIYGLLIVIFGFYYVIKNRNSNNEVLIVSAYIVGYEVLLRMAGGGLLYEFSKYLVIVFMLLGMYFSNFSKNAIPFWIYILLLIPGILVATETLSLQNEIRNTLAFNISGPFCLGIASIYNFNRKILLSSINDILLALGLPIISILFYLILYTPDLKEVVLGTGSNYATSGGFGPNQVSTILGLGMFIFFSRLILNSKTKFIFILNLIIVLSIGYRGLLTFSRGGMITGFSMIIVLLIYFYINTQSTRRYKLNILVLFMILSMLLTWFYTSNQTNGLIDKRYANKDAAGRIKKDKFSGREEIWDSEIRAFQDNPIFGIGVGKGLEYRLSSQEKISALSHNEISRTISEHGSLGIFALIIVFFTPIFLFLDNKQHIYMFCFLLFWLLTINHAAMRTAAPAFVYSLSLLKVYIDEESSI